MAIRTLEQCVTIDEDDVKKYIKYTYSPEEIFDESDLETWAKQNDFIKKQDSEED